MQARALALLGRDEVADVLRGERGHDDAVDPHRAGPREGLGVHPRGDDEDRARPSDVEHRRPGIVGRGRDLEPAARRRADRPDAREPAAFDIEPDPHPGPDLAHDAGGRRFQDPARLAGREPPPAAQFEQELALDRRVRSAAAEAPRSRASDRSTTSRCAGPPRPWAGPLRSAAARAAAPRAARRRAPIPRPPPSAGLRAGAGTRPTAPAARAVGPQRGRAPAACPIRPPCPSDAHAPSSVHVARCQPARVSRRRSGASGSCSGTSRRSTSRPPRPPPTSSANRRPRPPSTTPSRNSSSAVRVMPGGSSTSSRWPPTRSRVIGVAPAWRTSRPTARPAWIPCGTTAVASGASRSSASSASRTRRSASSSIVPIGPSRRAWS